MSEVWETSEIAGSAPCNFRRDLRAKRTGLFLESLDVLDPGAGAV